VVKHSPVQEKKLFWGSTKGKRKKKISNSTKPNRKQSSKKVIPKGNRKRESTPKCSHREGKTQCFSGRKKIGVSGWDVEKGDPSKGGIRASGRWRDVITNREDTTTTEGKKKISEKKEKRAGVQKGKNGAIFYTNRRKETSIYPSHERKGRYSQRGEKKGDRDVLHSKKKGGELLMVRRGGKESTAFLSPSRGGEKKEKSVWDFRGKGENCRAKKNV